MTAATLHVTAERAPSVMLPRWLLHSPASDGAKVRRCAGVSPVSREPEPSDGPPA